MSSKPKQIGKTTPLQKDPKQQELRTHLRPRLDLRPYEEFFEGLVRSRTIKTLGEKTQVLQHRSEKV